MYASDDSVLYVGKARELKKRVGSYFNATPRPARTMAMLAQVARMRRTPGRERADSAPEHGGLGVLPATRAAAPPGRRHRCAASRRGLWFPAR